MWDEVGATSAAPDCQGERTGRSQGQPLCFVSRRRQSLLVSYRCRDPIKPTKAERFKALHKAISAVGHVNRRCRATAQRRWPDDRDAESRQCVTRDKHWVPTASFKAAGKIVSQWQGTASMRPSRQGRCGNCDGTGTDVGVESAGSRWSRVIFWVAIAKARHSVQLTMVISTELVLCV